MLAFRWQITPKKGSGQGLVTQQNFEVPVIYLELVKLGTSHLDVHIDSDEY